VRGEPNDDLRCARERTPSRLYAGEAMSRRELAEAVNAWLWATTGKLHELDARVIARYERGAVRWPGAHYRAALRHVLGTRTDAALGFRPSTRHAGTGRGCPRRPRGHRRPWRRTRSR